MHAYTHTHICTHKTQQTHIQSNIHTQSTLCIQIQNYRAQFFLSNINNYIDGNDFSCKADDDNDDYYYYCYNFDSTESLPVFL